MQFCLCRWDREKCGLVSAADRINRSFTPDELINFRSDERRPCKTFESGSVFLRYLSHCAARSVAGVVRWGPTKDRVWEKCVEKEDFCRATRLETSRLQ
jgi:hypothetical protein